MMKAVIIRAAVAILLLGAGRVSWTAGRLEGRLAEADRLLAMLRYEGPLSEYDDIEQTLGNVGRLPWIAADLVNDLREQRATAQYWNASYGALSFERDASDNLVEQNPDVLLMAANAAYRVSQRAGSDRQAAVRALDAVVSNYAEVLKNAPGNIDAAYNYEFAVRAREVAAGRGRQVASRKPGATAPSSPEAVADDLPTGPTLHGRPGAPPKETDMNEFKVLVPMRPDERRDQPDKAGTSRERIRRG